MTEEIKCPKCHSSYSYQDRNFWICSECAHEWDPQILASDTQEESGVKDAHGNVLKDGDTVTVIKDLKIGGSSSNVIKVGTKAKNIRLIDGPDGHNIACKIEGFGAMNLKSEFVKKSN